MPMSCLKNLLEIQAKQHQDAIAITASGRSHLKYRQLNQHINHLVTILNSYGISHHDRVAIVLPNGSEMAEEAMKSFNQNDGWLPTKKGPVEVPSCTAPLNNNIARRNQT